MQLVLLISTLLSFLLSFVTAVPTCGLVPPSNSQTTISNNSGNNSTSEDVVASAWLPGWLTNFDLNTIPWQSYSHLTFSFAVTTNDQSMVSLDKVNTAFLQSFVSRAHQENVGALVSIGGWTGSQYYSTLMQPSNQAAFVNTIVSMVKQYNLDGIDFDWEYPGKQGIGCNQISPDDSSNFLSFLQKLRQDPVGSKLKLTAAVSITPFAGPDGTPMSDVSKFGEVLDFLNIMNYDIWGSWSSTVGPNAPLFDSCAPTAEGSGQSAVKAWTGAGFPANKIVLGVAAYGHSFSVAQSVAVVNGALGMYPTFNKAMQPPGQGETASTTTTDQCGNSSGPTGIWTFEGLVSGGFLQNNNGTIAPATGVMYTYDNCSQTPFIYDPNKQIMVSFDDATSFAAKGKFINDNGLAGFAMWDATGDTPQNTLINAISDAIGIEQYCN